MEWHKLSLRLASPSLTPWQADTIFGHLCWALAYTEGADYLDVFLGLYGLDEPPLVISNGFPGDLLPRPLLSPPRPAARTLEAKCEAFRQAKEAKQAAWLTPDEFEAARHGQPVTPVHRPTFKITVSMHNQISRLTGTTGPEGSLYSLEEIALDERCGDSITVYALVAPHFIACLDRCVAYLKATGYGKRKSAGYGAIAEATLEPFAGFAPLANANGFISLSNFVPAAADPTTGAWRTMVKRGKLAEDYAVSHQANHAERHEVVEEKPVTLGEGDATDSHVFKRPVVMLEAAACFYDTPIRPYYGRLVKDVHDKYPQVVQYGMALAVPARLPEAP